MILTPHMDQQELTKHVTYLSHGKNLLWNFTTVAKWVTSEIRKSSRSGFISGPYIIFTRTKLEGSHMRAIIVTLYEPPRYSSMAKS